MNAQSFSFGSHQELFQNYRQVETPEYLYSRSELQVNEANKEVIGLSDKIKEVRGLSDKINDDSVSTITKRSKTNKHQT